MPNCLEESDVPCSDAKSAAGSTTGTTPPDVCVSCGATADRFRPMDEAEVDAVTGELSSYGVAGQGFDDIEVEYTRRIRLLSFVDASFYTNFVARSGPR